MIQTPSRAPAGEGHVAPSSALDPLASAYLAALMASDRRAAVSLVVDAAAGGRDILELYESVFAPAQREIGAMWQRGEITVATEHFCTAVTQVAMAQLYPYVFGTERIGLRLVATSAQGNLHELGIRMVSDIFELHGWDTFYLGADTPHGDVVEAIASEDADLLLVSAAMDEHVPEVAALVRAVRADRRTSEVPVLVGGAPFLRQPSLVAEVGADASTASAGEAVAVAESLVAR